MATVTKPIALDESLNTTEQTPRNIADVLAQELSRITGRNASQVEYDNSESGLDADNVQDALDEINGKIPTVPSVDIQTAVDEFSTYNGGLLSECKVALEPVQDLHGYSEPWVGGAGKNKMPITATSQTISGVTITVNDDGSFHVNGTATADIYLELGETSVSANTWIGSCGVVGSWSSYGIYIRNVTDNVTINIIDSQDFTFTLSATKTIRFILLIKSGQTVNTDFYPMLRLSTESDPTFAPYSNICPISGHTQVEVDVSDGQTTQEQVTVNLGGTYYSGTLDVVSGELTVDSAFIASYNGETLPSTWISDRDVYAVGTTPTTGAEVCYKLATPTPIQLTPQQVKALVGENHLSTPLDGQEITESKYKQMFTFDDVIAYIQSLS